MYWTGRNTAKIDAERLSDIMSAAAGTAIVWCHSAGKFLGTLVNKPEAIVNSMMARAVFDRIII